MAKDFPKSIVSQACRREWPVVSHKPLFSIEPPVVVNLRGQIPVPGDHEHKK
jgi:hypothetical protein